MTKYTQGRVIIGYLLIAMLALFAAGCGGSGGGDTTTTGGNTTGTGTSSGTGSNSSTGSSSGTGTGGSTAAAGVVTILADPGPIVEVAAGDTVNLDGSNSYATSGDPLTYAWSFTHVPDGSTAQLSGETTATPSFVADVAGVYMVQLIVSTADLTSKRAIAHVTATSSTLRPLYFHEGLSSNCMNCHDGVQLQYNGDVLISKSPDHIPTSNVCQACHTTFGFKVIGFVDHDEVFGLCSECHNGVIATGKSATHPVTTQECSDCHNTTSFLTLNADGTFDHSTIVQPCSACHNGTTAIGTDSAASHPSIGATECNACHTTVTFKTPFVDHTDYSQVGGKCSGCHDGTIALGQTSTHPDTTGIECDNCHNVVSFNMGGVFDHKALARYPLACATCHDGVSAIGQGDAPTPHIATSPTSDCSNCHNTTNFKAAFVDHATDADVLSHLSDCAFCHDGSNPDILGKPSNHIPTAANCADCHIAGGSFSLATVDHTTTAVDGVCTNCHEDNGSGAVATVKTVNHLPTTEQCDVCHDKLRDTFAGGTFDHVAEGITSNCASCHDGVISSGKSTSHVPTDASLDCAVCHGNSNFTSFAMTTFDHTAAGITNNCASCHDGRLHDGKVVMGKSAKHIPAVDDCSTCHASTVSGGFATASKFDSTVHPTYVAGCGGCHNGNYPPALGKSAAPSSNHIPTSQDCYICHTNDIADAFKTSIFSHAGITSGCETCHDGTHQDSNALGKVDAVPTHITTTADCHACHQTTGTDFKNAYVDHTSSTVTSVRCDSCHDGLHPPALGKADAVPTHVATTQDCGVCHTPGGSFATAVFDHSTLTSGTRCDSCHNNTASATAIGPSSTHIPIPNDSTGNPEDCKVCHNTTAFAGAAFDHSTLTSTTRCDSCHDGGTATGKTVNHVPTSQDCRVCHVTAGFLPATFDHSGPEATGKRCDSCHDGVIATGKTSTHIATNDDCGVCHNTTNFADATGMPDHSTIVDGCGNSGCHDGSVATTVSKNDFPNHIPTTADCHFCHTPGTFATATMDHSVVTATACATCHDGTHTDSNALGKSSTHFVTTKACDNCHKSTTVWTPISYTHPSSSDYPGDHNSSVTCDSCHKAGTAPANEVITSFENSTYTPYCAACHSNQYRSGDHGGNSINNRLDCGKSGCHRVSSRSF